MKKDQNSEYKVRSLDVYKKNQELKEGSPKNILDKNVKKASNKTNQIENKTYKKSNIINKKRSKKRNEVQYGELENKQFKKRGSLEKKTKKRIKRMSKSTKKFWALNTVLISSAAGIVFLLIILMNRYSIIMELRYDINSSQRTLNELRNKKREIQVQIEHSNRTDFIEKTAREQLFMEYPSEDETVYIRVD